MDKSGFKYITSSHHAGNRSKQAPTLSNLRMSSSPPSKLDLKSDNLLIIKEKWESASFKKSENNEVDADAPSTSKVFVEAKSEERVERIIDATAVEQQQQQQQQQQSQKQASTKKALESAAALKFELENGIDAEEPSDEDFQAKMLNELKSDEDDDTWLYDFCFVFPKKFDAHDNMMTKLDDLFEDSFDAFRRQLEKYHHRNNSNSHPHIAVVGEMSKSERRRSLRTVQSEAVLFGLCSQHRFMPRGKIIISILEHFGFQLKGVTRGNRIFVCLRAPIDLLRKYAGLIKYVMLLDEVELSKLAESGCPEHEIAPIVIPHVPHVARLRPFQW